MENKNLNEIFEMEKIEKAPQKAEYLFGEESFSNPLDGERGFFGTVFQGVSKDISIANDILLKKEFASEYDLVATEKNGIYQLRIQCDEDEEEAVREILRSVPGLKMVSFFAWWGGDCAVCYSHSGYPYITKFPNSRSMILQMYYSKTQDEPWIYYHSADESFSACVDGSRPMRMFHYTFPEEKDWNAINYITEIDGSLYKLNGYR